MGYVEFKSGTDIGYSGLNPGTDVGLLGLFYPNPVQTLAFLPQVQY